MSAERLKAGHRAALAAPILEARRLSRRSPTDGKRLLGSISLTVDVGAQTVVQGPSGSGKSVLLRALAALDPAEGELLWNGHPLTPSQIPAFRAAVCYLHQSSSFPEGTVRDALDEPFRWAVHQQQAFDPDAATALLASLGYEAAFLAKFTADLSGGESQVLAAVRALQLAPTLLLLDEPTAAMDPATAGRFESLILDWVSQPGRGFLWVTHDPAQAERMGTRVLSMADGAFDG